MHLSAIAILALCAAPAAAQQPNIVMILADDVGTDFVGAYAEGNEIPCTPNIDALASQGMLFRNAWTNTLCSPSRASLLTGRYAFRHGIGVTLLKTEPGLALSEVTLPEVLTGYTSAALGKWHLSGDQGPLHPNDSGFAEYRGSLYGAVEDYFAWTKTINGVQSSWTTYAVTDTIDDAVAAVGTLPEPWFVYVSLNAIHDPFHIPPAALCPGGCEPGYCQNISSRPSTPNQARAMMEAMDTEVGRLLTAVGVQDPNAFVVFMGDNGTYGPLSVPPFEANHGKGTMYEGGIGVPLIVKGPGVEIAQCGALVSSTDLYATFAELAGVPSEAEDSVSLVPYFSAPAQPSLRKSVYTERFFPNHGWPKQDHQQAIRGRRFKLIRILGQPDQFFDLVLDPFETTNLSPELTPSQKFAYDELVAELDALLAGAPQNYCTAGTSASGCQAAIGTYGIPSASSTSGFDLRVSGMEGQKDGIFFFGSDGRQANPWGSGTSYQCVAPRVKRAGFLAGTGNAGQCDGSAQQDLNAIWCASCPQPWKNPGAGATVQAQFWYRDPQNTSNQTTSLSDAVEFVLEP